jgi:hypothetical protein
MSKQVRVGSRTFYSLSLLVHGPIESLSFACLKIVSKADGSDEIETDFAIISGPMSLDERRLEFRYALWEHFMGNFDTWREYYLLALLTAKMNGEGKPDPNAFEWSIVDIDTAILQPMPYRRHFDDHSSR